MARIQYQPAAQSGGYRPQQTDERKIARMREEAARQVEGMQRVANAELRQRQTDLDAMKADEAATAKANERNYQTATGNSQRYLKGLQNQQARDQQQFNQNQADNATIFKSLSSLSSSAGVIAVALQEAAAKRK